MTKRLANRITWLLLFVATLIMLKVYIQNHSLFLDELNLARNIIEQDYLEFFKPLNYQQFCPPLFLCVEKLIIQVIGVSDYTLRFIPFLLAIFSLVLFVKIIQNVIENIWSQLFAIILFAYSSEVIYHAIEVKQYTGDLFTTLLIIYTVLILKWRPKTYLLKLSLLGIMAIWFSMSSVFVLAGTGLYLWFSSEKTEKSKTLLVIFLWVMSFLIFYFTILKPSISSAGLVSFHSPYYFGRNGNLIEQIAGLFSSYLDKTAIPIIGGVILFILGVFKLYSVSKQLLLLLFIPIISMLFASFIGQYSIIPRLILFSYPFWIIIISFGFSLLINLPKKYYLIKIPLLLVSILTLFTTLINHSSLQYVVYSMEKEEGRSALLAIPIDNTSPIYLTHHAIPSYEYYCKLIDNPILVNGEIIKGGFNPNLSLLKETLVISGISTFWILDVHTFGSEKQHLDNQIANIGKIINQIDHKSASALLIDMKSDIKQ